MKEKVVKKIMQKIKDNNKDLNQIKLEEIQYGLYGIYTIITKTTAVILLSVIFGIFENFIIFLLFYGVLRSVGFGTHAKSNLTCWIFSILLLFGIPFLFIKLNLSLNTLKIIWLITFINYLLFCPADTEKRPIISIKRKMIFKSIILLISVAYLLIIINYTNLANLIVSALVLEALLTNPLGYILMGQKPRFRLNDIYLFSRE